MKNKIKLLSCLSAIVFFISGAWAAQDPEVLVGLQDAKRNITWSELPSEVASSLSNPFVREFGIDRLDLATCESFIDAALTIAGADGLSEPEIAAYRMAIARIEDAVKPLFSPVDCTAFEGYLEEGIRKAQSGEYKDSDVKALADRHTNNIINLLGKDMSNRQAYQHAAAKVLLISALEVSGADGLSEIEIKEARSIATELGIDSTSFEWILDYSKLIIRANTSGDVKKAEVDALLSKISS